jgi:hypothetical protein
LMGQMLNLFMKSIQLHVHGKDIGHMQRV